MDRQDDLIEAWLKTHGKNYIKSWAEAVRKIIQSGIQTEKQKLREGGQKP